MHDAARATIGEARALARPTYAGRGVAVGRGDRDAYAYASSVGPNSTNFFLDACNVASQTSKLNNKKNLNLVGKTRNQSTNYFKQGG